MVVVNQTQLIPKTEFGDDTRKRIMKGNGHEAAGAATTYKAANTAS